MVKIVKGVVDEKGNLVTFMNDKDGFSARDFLMMVTMGLFSLSFISALVLIILGKGVNDSFFNLMEAGKPVFITVIGGVMGVQCTEAITNAINKRTASRHKTSTSDNDPDNPAG